MNRKVHGNLPEENDFATIKRTPMLMMHEITRLMGDKIREKGDDNPISQKSGRLIMMELAKRDGRTQLDLVNATHLKAPTISVALQKLEHDGFVLRRPDEYDLRATRVFLTDKGRELDNTLRKRFYEEEARAMENLTESECETLVKLLGKIKQNLIKDKEEGTLY